MRKLKREKKSLSQINGVGNFIAGSIRARVIAPILRYRASPKVRLKNSNKPKYVLDQ